MDADQTEQAEKAEKSRLADLKMAEMRKKNELLMKRHEEIEADKRNANLFSKMAGLKINENESDQLPERRTTQVKGRGSTSVAREQQQQQQQQRPSIGRGTTNNRSPNQLPARNQENGPPPDPKFNYLDDPGRKGDLSNHQQRPNRGRGFAKSQSFDVENRSKMTPGGVGRGVMTKKDMELVMTGTERLNYQNWLNERTKIDAERLSRQQTSSGEWRREWDAEKAAKTRENELPHNQKGNRYGGHQKYPNSDAPGREFDQKFDHNQRGEFSKRQDSRDGYQGGNSYRDNRRPRRYSDSDDHPKSSHTGTGRGFNPPRTAPANATQGFSVFPANSGGGNLPPKSPRIDVDTVKFSIRDASNQGQTTNDGFGTDNNRYQRDNRRQYQQNRGGGGRFDSHRDDAGRGGNFQRSGLRNSDRQMQTSRGFSSNGSDRSSSQNQHGSRDKRQPNRRNQPSIDEEKRSKVYSRRTLSYEGPDASSKKPTAVDRQTPTKNANVHDQTSAAAPEENWNEEADAAAIGAADVVAKDDQQIVVDEEDDQWEDVDEEDEPTAGSRRRAVSEEYRRPASEGRQEYDGEEEEEDEFAEPEEYGAYDDDRQNREHFEEAANDQSYDDDDERAASLMDDSRQRNESMDQIEREMIARLNENIEAAEAALGKHDEDLDVILFGARVDRDIDSEFDMQQSSNVKTSSRAVEVPNVDDEVKLCVENLLTCVN